MDQIHKRRIYIHTNPQNARTFSYDRGFPTESCSLKQVCDIPLCGISGRFPSGVAPSSGSFPGPSGQASAGLRPRVFCAYPTPSRVHGLQGPGPGMLQNGSSVIPPPPPRGRGESPSDGTGAAQTPPARVLVLRNPRPGSVIARPAESSPSPPGGLRPGWTPWPRRHPRKALPEKTHPRCPRTRGQCLPLQGWVLGLGGIVPKP